MAERRARSRRSATAKRALPTREQEPAKHTLIASEPEPTAASDSEGLRARHKRDKRERLRAAAFHLFSTVGYEATTTRAIAERAGVASGTVFLYARDKQDLLFLVFEDRLRAAVDDGFRTLPRGAALNDQLLHIFGRIFAMYAENSAVGRQFVKEFPGADGPNAERVNALTLAFFQRVAGLVERAQEKGTVRKSVLPWLAAQTFFALYYMSLMTWLTGFNTLETALDPVLRSSLDLLMQGLEAREKA